MYERILLATDFSKHAQKIIDCVGDIPGVKEIILLHVLAKDPGPGRSPGDEKKQAVPKMEVSKKALEGSNLTIKVRVEIAEDTPEHLVIQRVAEEEDVSLVVMGARGRGIWQGLLLGSVSNGYLRYGKSDLLIIRYKTLGDADKEELDKFCSHMFEKVLAPTDFSGPGNAAIDKIMAAKITNNVLLLNVVARGENQAQVDAALRDAKGKLEQMKADLAKAGINAKTRAISAAAGEARTYGSGGMVKVETTSFASVGGVVGRILSTAEIEDASLIAMGSHGKGWLDDATIGSVVSDVARMGPRPVLIVRSKK